MAPTATLIDRDTFQRVMACFPAGVSVVTAIDSAGRPRGLTTTAVASVSLEPPLLLVCVDRASRTLPAIQEAGNFAVNLLEAAHTPVARRFASKTDDKFTELAWSAGIEGAPILHDHCVAWAECRIQREFEAGDHQLFIGEVVDGGFTDDGRHSLVYFRRNFGRWIELED